MSKKKKYPELQDREWLYEHFIVKGLGKSEISRIIGCHFSCIDYRLKSFNIKKEIPVPDENTPVSELVEMYDKFKHSRSESEQIRKEITKRTNFLPADSLTMQRVWHLRNEFYERVTCTQCDNFVEWPVIGVRSGLRYNRTCSSECQSKNFAKQKEEIVAKRKKTSIKRYGVENYAETQESKDKVKATSMERYGVEHYAKTKECKDYKKSACLKKHGVTHHTKTQNHKDKMKAAYMEKYGVDNYRKTKECRIKIKATCLKKYGVDHNAKQHISKFNLTRLTNYHFMRYWYVEKGVPTTELCKNFGISDGTIARYLWKLDIPINHNYSRSYAEREIEEFLISHDIVVEVGNRDILNRKEIDLYLPEYKIGIEYNGLFWHTVSPKNKRITRKYHARKTQDCNNAGVRLIQIFEDEWIYRKEQVKLKLLSLVGKDPRSVVYARKCKIVEVTTRTKTEFFDNNHIQGSGPGSINIGLVYDGELVACMSFIKQKEQHYLNRYATSCRVPGGFSKLLKYFKNNYEWELLISFADLRWSDGNLYKKTGWLLDKIIAEDYAYVVGDTRVHKFNFRRKYLPDKLEVFDASLSEVKNCANNGLYPIYDCGKMRFVILNE